MSSVQIESQSLGSKSVVVDSRSGSNSRDSLISRKRRQAASLLYVASIKTTKAVERKGWLQLTSHSPSLDSRRKLETETTVEY